MSKKFVLRLFGRTVSISKAPELNAGHRREPLLLDAASASRLQFVQMTSLLAHASTATLISTLFAVILSLYLLPIFGFAAKVWLTLKVVGALPRFALSQAYGRGWWTPSLKVLRTVVWTSFFLDGVVWGLPGVWAAGAPGEILALIVACVASVGMLATFALQIQLKATMAFVLPLLVPMAVALFYRGDALGAFAATGTVLVLVQTLVTSLASERRMTREHVAHERLADALEDVKRQSAVKTLFLGTMSHELRTPLHGILGLTELVQRQTSDAQIASKLRLIRSSGEHLLELIGALLDVSRIDSGKLELHLAPVDLVAELKAVAELYAVRAEGNGLSFETQLDLGSTCWVKGDATRFRQVLHNLLGNAIKFTKRGVISLSALERDGTFVIEVSDTGSGIAAKDLPYIFEAFRQADDTASRPAEGAGLGLTIARELAVAMGGDLTVASTIGVGSRFGFALRPKRLQGDELPAAARSPAAPQHLRSAFHVLLVEDNEVNAMIAQSHLDRLGVLTTRVSNGKLGVEAAFASPRPDLILMDVRMPVLDGASATREIRMVERTAGMSRVPVIALTATPAAEDREECFAAGMDGFLTKPFTDVQLLNAIRVYLTEATADQQRTHPLFELASSLEDTDPVIGVDDASRTMH